MTIFDGECWQPQIDKKRVERAYRRVLGRHQAALLEIRECTEEESAAGIAGGVISWPLGSKPGSVRRDFYGVYARRHSGELVALLYSESLAECKCAARHLEKLWAR